MDTQAAPVFDRTQEDVGNIVEFGHLNMRVPDQRLATLFYVTGLGLTRDPFLNTGTDNMWVNAGTHQFHLPSGPAQVVRGMCGLVLPDLDALRGRLARVRSQLGGTAFTVEDHGAFIDTTCPWGNRIRCHAPEPRFGQLRLGFAYVELAAPPGSATGLARFYREVMRAPATAADGAARIGIGQGFSLTFVETDIEQPDWDGNHLQISLADFSGPHAWLLARGLVTEESDQHQYRFHTIVDVDSLAPLLQVEHEVRSMRHPLFARPLVNRNASQTPARYAPGHEIAPWALPLA